MSEEYIITQISNWYDSDLEQLQKTFDDFQKIIYDRYTNVYWYRIKSKRFLKKFLSDLKQTSLLPDKETYINMFKNNEIFSLLLRFSIVIEKECLLLYIPILINISSLSRNLTNSNKPKSLYQIDEIAKYVVEEYWDDYEQDLMITNQKQDIINEERANNPIILINKSDVNEYTLLNGNHRIMAMKHGNKQENIETYLLEIDECIEHALSKDWNIILNGLRSMNQNVKGSRVI